MADRDKFILNLAEKVSKEYELTSGQAYSVARKVASEYIGQPIQPLVEYYVKQAQNA